MSRYRRLEILEPGERQTLLEGFNATSRPVPEATLPALFEAQVARTPEAVAVVFDQESLSYCELNTGANRLAHYLIGLGVGPESLVGIALERSMDLVVALLGTLKAGGAYLPLDPDYPQARLAHMLADAAPALVVSTGALRTPLPQSLKVLNLDELELQAGFQEIPAHNPVDGERSCALLHRPPASRALIHFHQERFSQKDPRFEISRSLRAPPRCQYSRRLSSAQDDQFLSETFGALHPSLQK
jgi:non-ribosomal peptide synthetase component F